MKTQFYVVMPRVKNDLALLGENIKLARLRRSIPMRIICDKARISRPTLSKIEKGDDRIAIGKYAMVLHVLGGYSTELTKVMREDELGRTIQDLQIKTPKRARR